MKKSIVFVCFVTILLLMTITAFAGDVPEDFIKIKNAKVLSDLLVFDRSNVAQIEVVYPGNGDSYGCFVDTEKFFDIAEQISLTKENKIDELKNGVWIIAVDKENNRYSFWLDQKMRIGCPKYETSSAVTTQYVISRADYMKLYSFLPEEATEHMPLQKSAIPYLFATIGAVILIFLSAFSVRFVTKAKGVSQK